jgi:Predicted integral membrane protein
MKRTQLIALTVAALLGLGAAVPQAEAAGDRHHDRHGLSRGHDRGPAHHRDHGRKERAHYNAGYREGYRDARHHSRPVVVHHRPAPPPPPRHVWARGQRFHDHYHGPVYVVHDYPRYHLRHPPHGHHWVRDDRGNMLLVAIATGVIADLILHH